MNINYDRNEGRNEERRFYFCPQVNPCGITNSVKKFQFKPLAHFRELRRFFTYNSERSEK